MNSLPQTFLVVFILAEANVRASPTLGPAKNMAMFLLYLCVLYSTFETTRDSILLAFHILYGARTLLVSR